MGCENRCEQRSFAETMSSFVCDLVGAGSGWYAYYAETPVYYFPENPSKLKIKFVQLNYSPHTTFRNYRLGRGDFGRRYLMPESHELIAILNGDEGNCAARSLVLRNGNDPKVVDYRGVGRNEKKDEYILRGKQEERSLSPDDEEFWLSVASSYEGSKEEEIRE